MPARLAEGPCYGRLASQLRPPFDIMAAVGFLPSALRFSVIVRINGIIPSKMICIYVAILACFYARSQTRGRASPERTAYLRAGCPSGLSNRLQRSRDCMRGRLHASTSPSRTPIRIVRMLSYPPSPDCAATCLSFGLHPYELCILLHRYGKGAAPLSLAMGASGFPSANA